MDSSLEKKIKARLEELPEDVQRAIKAADLGDKIAKIGTKFKLHVDQLESLDIETRLVMLGFVDPQEFPTEIQNNVKISQDQAELVAEDISTEIFLPIRDSMRQYMEERMLIDEAKQETTPEKKELPIDTKPSVVMPSATKVETAPTSAQTPAPVAPPVAAAPAAPLAGQAKPVTPPAAPLTNLPAKVDLHAADVMLSEPTISVAPLAGQAKPAAPAPATPAAAPASPAASTPAAAPKAAPATPPPYKVDPYREPPE